MKHTLTILFFFINLNSILFSQEFRDQLSNDKIPILEIYSDKGELIGITDLDGSLSIDLKNKITSTDTKCLNLNNSFYKNRIIEINDFNEKSIFLLSPMVNELKEVVISPQKNTNKYLVLKTYVRSLQINNDKIHYFMDGIVEYYISLKTKKVKIYFLSNRSFENQSIKQLKEKGLTPVNFQITGAPNINDFLNYNKLKEDYGFQEKEREIKIFDPENNNSKGSFFTNENGGNLSLGIITNDNPKIMKGLGVENILLNFNIKSLFNTTTFEEVSSNSLLYFKETRIYEIKTKKDTKYQKIDATHEVFVLDYQFSDDVDVKKTTNNYSFIDSSSYSEKYWENVNNILFQPLPESIELFIKENLKEL